MWIIAADFSTPVAPNLSLLIHKRRDPGKCAIVTLIARGLS